MAEKCKGEMWQGIWHGASPCRNKAKLDGYCLVHHPDEIKKREEKRYNKMKQDPLYIRKRKRSWGVNFYEALEKIKDGHNDPRQLATEILNEFNK